MTAMTSQYWTQYWKAVAIVKPDGRKTGPASWKLAASRQQSQWQTTTDNDRPSQRNSQFLVTSYCGDQWQASRLTQASWRRTPGPDGGEDGGLMTWMTPLTQCGPGCGDRCGWPGVKAWRPVVAGLTDGPIQFGDYNCVTDRYCYYWYCLSRTLLLLILTSGGVTVLWLLQDIHWGQLLLWTIGDWFIIVIIIIIIIIIIIDLDPLPLTHCWLFDQNIVIVVVARTQLMTWLIVVWRPERTIGTPVIASIVLCGSGHCYCYWLQFRRQLCIADIDEKSWSPGLTGCPSWPSDGNDPLDSYRQYQQLTNDDSIVDNIDIVKGLLNPMCVDWQWHCGQPTVSLA